MAADTVTAYNAAPWASTAGNKFREVARSTENPSTKLLAEGLTALAEALRELWTPSWRRSSRSTVKHRRVSPNVSWRS